MVQIFDEMSIWDLNLFYAFTRLSKSPFCSVIPSNNTIYFWTVGANMLILSITIFKTLSFSNYVRDENVTLQLNSTPMLLHTLIRILMLCCHTLPHKTITLLHCSKVSGCSRLEFSLDTDDISVIGSGAGKIKGKSSDFPAGARCSLIVKLMFAIRSIGKHGQKMVQ